MKRYQDCNWIVKLWRLRHYVYIPFRWLRWMFDESDAPELQYCTSKTKWKILLGVAQCDMNWTYTREEVNEFIYKTKDD